VCVARKVAPLGSDREPRALLLEPRRVFARYRLCLRFQGGSTLVVRSMQLKKIFIWHDRYPRGSTRHLSTLGDGHANIGSKQIHELIQHVRVSCDRFSCFPLQG